MIAVNCVICHKYADAPICEECHRISEIKQQNYDYIVEMEEVETETDGF